MGDRKYVIIMMYKMNMRYKFNGWTWSKNAQHLAARCSCKFEKIAASCFISSPAASVRVQKLEKYSLIKSY